MKDAGYGFDLKSLNYGSDVNMDGLNVDKTAVKIPYKANKKFGTNAGWPAATGYTEEPGELEQI